MKVLFSFLKCSIYLCTVIILINEAKSQTVNYNKFSYVPCTKLLDTQVVNDIERALDTFFQFKNLDPTSNPVWDQADFVEYTYPFLDIYNIEASGYFKDNNFYKPLVLSVVENVSSYTVTIIFVGVDSNQLPLVNGIYNIDASYNLHGIMNFKRVTQRITSEWSFRSIGSIHYIVNPKKIDFDTLKAKRLDSFNIEISEIFNVELLPIKYYLCKDPIELYYIKGFTFFRNMYFDTTGGMVEYNRSIIYAANNSEWYPHELVHVYLQRYYPDCNFVVAEGLPTYLGGSAELTLESHLKVLRNYLEYNKNFDILSLLYGDIQIEKKTSSYYAISGLMCKLIIDSMGYKEVLTFARIDEENLILEFCKMFNIKEDNFNDFMTREIFKY